MNKTFIYIIILVLVAIPFSCQKIETLPPEPSIEFRSFSMFDSVDILGNRQRAGVLEFYFEDGDGDIGIKQTIPEYPEADTANLILYQFNKSSGIYPELPEDTLRYRVPYIERVGQYQLIKGTIEITILYIGFDEQDTIRYDFFLKDRAGNISNTSTSCDIVFSGDGGCVDI